MEFTNNEIATYLFCAQLAQTKTKPLTILEWNTVVKSLREQNMEPETLLKITSNDLLKILTNATEAQKERVIKKITARQKLGMSMLELKEIVHQGYGIMFRSQMPVRLKKLTQKFLPAFFYYAGDPSILLHRSLGVVGARGANNIELQQTVEIAKEAALNGVVIISGGAKGIDTTAVEATLKNGGKAVVFPADGLAKWIKKSTIRHYVLNGNLLLMSTQKLEAQFTGWYAMQRNKYIHAPSDAVLVASSKISEKRTSGTWEGVLDNLKFKWSPLYVIGSSEGVEKLKAEGNAKQFTSIEHIYKQHKSNEIDEEIASLIKLAKARGFDREALDKKFKEISSYYYREDMMNELGKERNASQKLVAYEQLSLEEYS
ncbi:DNA-processing protein DprA [Virgibacillus kimchii]